jgi:hypothetical protein
MRRFAGRCANWCAFVRRSFWINCSKWSWHQTTIETPSEVTVTCRLVDPYLASKTKVLKAKF